jgi:hypothetical protein
MQRARLVVIRGEFDPQQSSHWNDEIERFIEAPDDNCQSNSKAEMGRRQMGLLAW